MSTVNVNTGISQGGTGAQTADFLKSMLGTGSAPRWDENMSPYLARRMHPQGAVQEQQRQNDMFRFSRDNAITEALRGIIPANNALAGQQGVSAGGSAIDLAGLLQRGQIGQQQQFSGLLQSLLGPLMRGMA